MATLSCQVAGGRPSRLHTQCNMPALHRLPLAIPQRMGSAMHPQWNVDPIGTSNCRTICCSRCIEMLNVLSNIALPCGPNRQHFGYPAAARLVLPLLPNIRSLVSSSTSPKTAQSPLTASEATWGVLHAVEYTTLVVLRTLHLNDLLCNPTRCLPQTSFSAHRSPQIHLVKSSYHALPLDTRACCPAACSHRV
jgi:hypothetical protein